MSVENTFAEVLAELQRLHDRKGADYDGERLQYANVRGSSDWGIEPWKGAMVRATDKLRRLQKYAHTCNLANETVEDSLLDLATYTVIALVLWREQHNLGTN